MSKSSPTTPPLDREAKRRLAVIRHVEEVTGNVAMSCRRFGISRQAYYTWYRRYQAEGVEGLRSHSRAPKHSPNATHAEAVGKIIHLRQNYHFGPEKIAMYLKRYHDVTISKSGVWRILNRLDMGRLPASQRYKRHDRRWKRYEKQLPSHRVQIDVKFIEPLASVPQGRRGGRNKYFQFTAIDDCARLRVLRIYPTSNQATAIQFLDYVIQHLPFQVQVIQTDNGAEFQSAFHWHVLDKGIAHTYIKPRTPRSSTGSSTVSSSTTSRSSTTRCASGRTTTTTIAPTAASAARPPTNASSRRLRPRRNR